ncbi:thiamine/thiamine pyrophosphate ABC transporter permease ThiP [Pasteurella skyensis]|uniref:Thiamine transport system permease protein ThiP n=1 Tax=Phocoenobacter skyensis TaxID=97481 RepID=A0AAJ6N8H5_9PAST|nr:thiamine/thiamine pyrophosphate ABC transporter permease ThiP [Pasteurella skyensis]MDP8162006.1 thiamine/thiamine pyrophosphate ABC transporter permease ThiP [Pasteurella skyensis]MDP8172162.1 thiamine/thiamine pyrophosphate ABC transporter permease ThiP [Pasteurella skyensis]MDP8176490.1 thiamine/thiamine pyrophosphate ABC transporter permease ThiP [Pasteurella skyensis]MDP8178378.1 thiamine/thiamine pyrophosphate ABC transporter permease ThiP [Pasteurella skyensis]MDP8182866.1 thiamine/t
MLRYLTKYTAWLLYILIISLYGVSLYALISYSNQTTFWNMSESLRIVKYSLWQATLSALLSTLLGVLLGRAFFYLDFKAKPLFYKLVTFVWSLPSLVVIFAIIGVWGNSGWLSQLCHWLGIEWSFSLYGLTGILIAHLFLNIPLVAKYTMEGLSLISPNQHKLAAQLGLKNWHYFKIIELPTLKGILPYAFTNVFLLCFTSFPIVLMLGGGPKYSTLEVAIYQAVTFEFDFAKAIILIGIQIFIGLFLQIAMDISTKYAFNSKIKGAQVPFWKPTPIGWSKYFLQSILFLQIFAIIVPLINVIWEGISVSHFMHRLLNPSLWIAFSYSIAISLIASVSVISITYIIALESRQLAFLHKKIPQSILSGVTTYPLILPVFLLAVGLFLLFMEVELSTLQLLLIVGICNGLVLLPYVYRLIFSPMYYAFVRHDKLARSLNLTGFNRWRIVEKPYLIKPLTNAFSFAMSASLGSFSVIAFFGSPDFSSLPYLLYQQLGSYHTEDAAVTALILMLSALLPFLCIRQDTFIKSTENHE